MTNYYIIKNKKTGRWDICTDKSQNPPPDKYRWATDFKTEEEARNYLIGTLKKLKEEKVAQYPTNLLMVQKRPSVIVTLISYVFIILIILGIAWVAHFFITPKSTLSGSPQINSTWTNQFFTVVQEARGKSYTECSQLDKLASINYKDQYLNNNETILAPMYLETSYIDGIATSTTYGVTDPYSYFQELKDNYTAVYDLLMNDDYSYYGFYDYETVGTFGKNNITANATNVFVELGTSCQ